MIDTVDENDISIDAQGVATWEMNTTAPINGTYQGVFKLRTGITPMQEIEADRDYRELLGKNTELISSHIENLAYALTQLKQRVISGPPFWFDGISKFPGSQVRDKEIIEKVFEASVVAETKYRKMLQEKHKLSVEKLAKAIEMREQQEKEAQEAETSRSKDKKD